MNGEKLAFLSPYGSVRFLLLCLFFMLGMEVLCAQMKGANSSVKPYLTTIIEGSAPDYAGCPLVARVKDDYITDHYEVVGADTVAPSGDFRLVLSIDGPRLVSFQLGVYLCYLFIEPGENFRVGLPPRQDLSEAERLNPYFEPIELQLKHLYPDSTSLNARIAAFDLSLSSAIGSVLPRLRERDSKARVDSAWLSIKVDTVATSAFFKEYTRYRLSFFTYLTHREGKGTQFISDADFRNAPVLYTNPAYMDLFSLVYERYFVFHGRTLRGKQIFQAITDHQSLSELKEVLRQNENLGNNGPLEEMVILKALHDEFFSDNFSRQSLSVILDSLYHTTIIPEHKAIAMLIRERITKLLPGFIPRNFTLQDTYGRNHSLSEYRGKLVLLDFCSTASYTSIQDFALIERLIKMYGEHLQVVSICVDRQLETVKQFVKGANYSWPFLYYGMDPELITEYDVRAYPTYFLLDVDGKLIFSPAPSPREDLDFRLHYLFKDRGWTPRPL